MRHHAIDPSPWMFCGVVVYDVILTFFLVVIILVSRSWREWDDEQQHEHDGFYSRHKSTCGEDLVSTDFTLMDGDNDSESAHRTDSFKGQLDSVEPASDDIAAVEVDLTQSRCSSRSSSRPSGSSGSGDSINTKRNGNAHTMLHTDIFNNDLDDDDNFSSIEMTETGQLFYIKCNEHSSSVFSKACIPEAVSNENMLETHVDKTKEDANKQDESDSVTCDSEIPDRAGACACSTCIFRENVEGRERCNIKELPNAVLNKTSMPSTVIDMHRTLNKIAQRNRAVRKSLELVGPNLIVMVMARRRAMSEEGRAQYHEAVSEEFSSEDELSKGPFHRAYSHLVEMHKPIKNIARIEIEAQRYLELALPWTASSLVESICTLMNIGIISNFIGHGSMSAFVTVQFTLKFSQLFVSGILGAEYTAATHAIGAGNNFLAGQFVQIALIIRCAYVIPMLFMWCHCMDSVLLLFGFNQYHAEIALKYTRITAVMYLVDAIKYTYEAILDIKDHARFNSMMSAVQNLLVVIMLVPFVKFFKIELAVVGVIQVAMSLIFFSFHMLWTVAEGWLDPFWDGMFYNWAMSNSSAVKRILRNGTILASGHMLVDYCEWKILTIFAAYYGPSQVTAWLVLGSVWEVVAVSTYELAGAAQTRVAYHLGRGDVEVGKRSAHVFLAVGVSVSVAVFLIVTLWGDKLASSLTPNEKLQTVINGALPVIGCGNLTRVFETMSLSLVQAQGRTQEANFVYMTCSFLITIPFAALMVFRFHIDIQGIVAAVVLGHSTCGAILTHRIFQSDWEKISTNIRQMSAVENAQNSDGVRGASSELQALSARHVLLV